MVSPERIDGPPISLVWTESIRKDGGRVTFDGGPVRTGMITLLPFVLLSIGALFVIPFVSDFANRGGLLDGWTRAHLFYLQVGRVLLIVSLATSVSAWWRTVGVISKATVYVDGDRVVIDSASPFIAVREMPLTAVDYFASEVETHQVRMKRRDLLGLPHYSRTTYTWYEVHVHLKTGRKRPVARFREVEQALFVAQRLDALVERANAVRGLVRGARPIVPVPYR